MRILFRFMSGSLELAFSLASSLCQYRVVMIDGCIGSHEIMQILTAIISLRHW